MKKIYLGCIILSLILGGCSTSGATEAELSIQDEAEESSQNKIEWIITNAESRAVSTTPTWETDTLNYVILEIYKVPNRNGKFIHEEKELLETRKLYRGEVVTVSSLEDYDYKYITCINVVDFNRYSAFYAERNEINFFDYEGTIGMEVSAFYSCQIDNLYDKGWKNYSHSVSFRDPVEGYEITYDFLDKSVVQKFYEEHKDGGRIIWKN